MGQMSDGVVDVTNGSATVTGSNTTFTNVQVGNLFIVEGDLVSYEVSSITNDTELTLSAPYGGDTLAGVDYVIHQSFTPNNQYPFPERGDFETATIVKKAIKMIDDAGVSALPTDWGTIQ